MQSVGKNQYDAEPLRLITRQIDAAKIDPSIKPHIRLWARDIWDQITDDPRQQAVASAAVMSYLRCVQLQTRAITADPLSPNAERITAMYTRWSVHLAKCLRLIGIKRTPKGSTQSGKKGDVFTPPQQGEPQAHSGERHPLPGAEASDAA